MSETPPESTLSTPSPTERDSRHDDDTTIPSTSELQAMNTIKTGKPIHLIVATAVKPHLGIGLKDQLPWPAIRSDMAFFRKATTGASSRQNAVVMGRKTYESIPAKFRPLAGRVNVILTRSKVREVAERVLGELTKVEEGMEFRLVDRATVGGVPGEMVSIVQRDHEQPTVVITDSLEKAVGVDGEEVFCIGGAEIYGAVLGREGFKARARVLQTVVRKLDGSAFECDAFWPEELEGGRGWTRVERSLVEGWAGCEVPQAGEGWKKDEKAGVEIKVVGWERKVA